MMAILEQDSDENGESKFQRFMIAQKVHTGSEVELTPEEVASIKKRIGLAFGAAVVGPAFTILNG
jgi:hypothetical protein